jgi:hypothetical protein
LGRILGLAFTNEGPLFSTVIKLASIVVVDKFLKPSGWVWDDLW